MEGSEFIFEADPSATGDSGELAGRVREGVAPPPRKKRRSPFTPPSRARAPPAPSIVVVLRPSTSGDRIGCGGGHAPAALRSKHFSAQRARGGQVIESTVDCAACRGKHTRHVCGRVHVRRGPKAKPVVKHADCDACQGRHTKHTCGRGRPPMLQTYKAHEPEPPPVAESPSGHAYCSVCLEDVAISRMVPLECSHAICVECSGGCGSRANGGVVVRCPLCRDTTRLRLADRKRVVGLMPSPATAPAIAA